MVREGQVKELAFAILRKRVALRVRISNAASAPGKFWKRRVKAGNRVAAPPSQEKRELRISWEVEKEKIKEIALKEAISAGQNANIIEVAAFINETAQRWCSAGLQRNRRRYRGGLPKKGSPPKP